jgi:acetoacetyl-CoA synthetase
VIDRFSQIEPKVLLAVDGYRYGGKDFDRRAIVRDIADALPWSPRVVTFGYLDGSGWEDGVLPGDGGEELSFEHLPFEHASGCCAARGRRACRSRSSTVRAAS